LIIETPANWWRWYDFYQAVLKLLVEAGDEGCLHLEASDQVDAHLVDLSVKESVLQLNPGEKVGMEE
jgi:hypothetical protein